jgi:hypothetical protein
MVRTHRAFDRFPGYIFDGAGRLLGILKDLPAERAPVMSVPVQSGSQTPAAQLDRKAELQERIAELEQRIAAQKAANNGVPGRLSQMVR